MDVVVPRNPGQGQRVLIIMLCYTTSTCGIIEAIYRKRKLDLSLNHMRLKLYKYAHIFIQS